MVVDLENHRKVENFNKWFNYRGGRGLCPTVIDYWKMIEYNMVTKQARCCPQCGEPPVSPPRDYRYNSSCSNKHTWHICLVHRIINKGCVNSKVPLNECTCTG